MNTLANDLVIMESKDKVLTAESMAIDESPPTLEDVPLPEGSDNSSIRGNRQGKRGRLPTDPGEQRASKRIRRGTVSQPTLDDNDGSDNSSMSLQEELSEDSPANLDEMKDGLSIYHQPPYKPPDKYAIRKLYTAVRDQAKRLRVSRLSSF